jgi:hypothetical protein
MRFAVRRISVVAEIPGADPSTWISCLEAARIGHLILGVKADFLNLGKEESTMLAP